MKKRIIATALAALTCISLCAFSSCKKEEPQETTETTNVVKLNDFETFEKDVQLLRLMNGFGAVNHNEDKTYVKSGERSVQLRPKGYNFATVPPYLVIPTYSQRFEYGYGDFTKVNHLSMWFYNAEETEIEVGVGLLEKAIQNGQWYSTGYRIPAMYYTLQPGWTKVQYDIIADWMSLHPSFTLSAVHGIYVECPYSASPKLEDTPTLYLDDVQIHYQEQEHSKEMNIPLKADTQKGIWEIADFEDSIENSFFNMMYTGSTNHKSHVPTAKVVHASKHGVITSEGENVLEITLRAGTGEYGWPFLYGSAKLMKYAFKQVGQDLIDNPQNYQISFELYNTQDFKMGMTFYPQSATGKDLTGQSVQAEAHSWIKYSYNLGKLNDASAKYNEAGEKDYITNPGRFVFASSQFNTAEDTSDRHVLLDNIRIEKIA